MNKSELVAAIADRAGVSQKDAGNCLDAFFDIVAEEVAAGREVSVTGWIKFERVATKAREGRNPQTGEPVAIPAGTKTKVTAGSKLKAAGKS
ncbi:MAG: integration host factor [Actinomyces sp.]|nr:MAG: integration host factor [Actinomyces sp.]